MQMSEIKAHHYIFLIGGSILLIGALTGTGNMQGSREVASAARQRAQQIRIQETEFLFDAKETELASRTAIKRYQNGLVFVVSTANPNTAIAIIEGEAVIDISSREPLPDGTVVGDYSGNTGIIKDGVVSSVAFTGDRQVVQAAKEAADFAQQENGQGQNSNQFGG